MSTRTKNEICLALWRHYKALKAQMGKVGVGTAIAMLIEAFKFEIYLGAKVEQKDAFNNAAVNTFSLSSMQSMVLKKMGSVLVKQRLQFKETAEQALKGMAGYVVVKTEWAGIKNEAGAGAEAKVRITKIDGIGEFALEAENPWAHLVVGEPIWVTEPFIATGDNQGKAWHELTPDEQALANKSNEVRAASTFPKYLQKRRMVLDKIEINSDDRDAWLEMTFKNAADFDRQTFEDAALKEELGIEGVTEGDEDVQDESAKPPVDDTGNQAVNPDTLGAEAIDAADDSDPGPTEPPPAEEKF